MRRQLLLLGALFLAAPLRAYDVIDFLEEFPLTAASRPIAVAASPGRYYVLDEKKHQLFILDEKGASVKTVGGEEVFYSPRGLAVGPQGEVYVADTRNSRIQVLSPDGEVVRTIGAKGSAPGHLSKPESVDVGADGRVYVADTGNHRIQVFTREGIFLFGFGDKGDEPGHFKSPVKIIVDVSDHMYVLDEGNERVQKFNPRTKQVKEFKLHGDDFTADEYGFLYMLDRKRGKVKELSPDGFVLGGFGTSGKGKGQFKKPQGISVTPDGTVLVVDTGNKRLQRVRLTNRLKERKVAHNMATKLLVSGPSRKLPIFAGPVAELDGILYAYLPKEGRFVGVDGDGKEVLRFGTSKGKGESVTKGSSGFAVSKKLGFFISDTKGHKIQIFDKKGGHKANFGGTSGIFSSRSKEGHVKAPHGIAINEKGTIYVANTNNQRVEAFNPQGVFLNPIGPVLGPYELDTPVDVAFDEEHVFVLDRGLRKVFKVMPSGGYIKAWGEEGAGVGQFEDPVAIAYDGRSYLYVLDRGLKRVSVFDRDGQWVTNFFAGGADERGLKEPASLIVMDDSLVVSDPGRERVVAFKLHPRLAPPVKISTGAVEGQATLKWEPLKDPWVRSYRVQRSTGPFGPFADAGSSKKPVFKDGKVEAYQKYFYRVAVEAETGDLGPASRSVEVFVPGAHHRAPVELSTVAVGNIFSSNYKWYKDNPFGKVTVVNNLPEPFTNVKLALRLKDYMDFATEKKIARLPGKGSVEVDLVATLNNKILEITEDTPIQAEVTLTYFEKGKKQEVSQALPLRVYSRNAITWEDPNRIANYVTALDPPVVDLAREILRDPPKGPDGTGGLESSLVTAMRLWAGLGSVGIKFFPAPNSPFEKMSEDPAFPVDYTQFPRETLKRKSGECDDLVTLLASMLGNDGVRTALIDYPGHLALMFDLGTNDPLEAGIPVERLVEHGGTYWIPLEATMIGGPFEKAARKALFSYKEMAAQGKAKIIDLAVAGKTYSPATLPPTEQEVLKPDRKAYSKAFDKAAGAYVKARYEYLTGHLKSLLEERPHDVESLNLMGIVHAQHGNTKEAVATFQKALESEPANPGALNNLGNLAYLNGEFEKARKYYEGASKRDPADPGVWMNLLRSALKLEQRSQAAYYGKKAEHLDPSLKSQIETLMR